MSEAYGGEDDTYDEEETQEALRQALRRNPALATPTQGQPQRPPQGQMGDPNQPLPWGPGEGYQPNQGVAPNAPLRPVTSADVPPQQRVGLPNAVAARQPQRAGAESERLANEAILRQTQLMNQPVDISKMEEAARGRHEAASGDLGSALIMSAMGGSAFSPVGGHILQRALKAKEPYDVPGGYGTMEGGRFIPNEYKMRADEVQRFGTMATLHASMADRATNAEERARHNAATEDYQKRALEASTGLKQETAEANRQNRERMQKNEVYRQTRQLGEQYMTRSAKANEAGAHAQTLQSVLSDPAIEKNGVRQVALIMAFGKMLDPDSVVREAEQRMIANARGVFDTLSQFIPRLMTGAQLTPTQIKQIRDLSKEMLAMVGGRADALKKHYADIALRNQFDVRDVIPGYLPPEEQMPAPGADPRNPLRGPVQTAPVPAPAQTQIVEPPRTSGGRQTGPYQPFRDSPL